MTERAHQFVGERKDFSQYTPVSYRKRVSLPDVTLVMVETREHELAYLAVGECLDKAEFGNVLIFTDQAGYFRGQGDIIHVPDWPEKIGWSRHTWQGISPYMRTSHALCIQWDSWIMDPGKWRDEWLQYDFIGAPWWYKDGKNVGNGGFSLRSTRLMRYLRDHRDRFPCHTALDDDLLCRGYRPELEDRGFVWAPQDVAQDFAFECVRPDKSATHFGFHACFNFGIVLDRDRLIERARLMNKSEYIKNSSHMWSNFIQANSHIVDEL